MAKTIPLKRMTAAEAMRERGRIRVKVGTLVLQRMSTSDAIDIDIDARLLKLRRRIARLDRRIRIARATNSAGTVVDTTGQGVGRR